VSGAAKAEPAKDRRAQRHKRGDFRMVISVSVRSMGNIVLDITNAVYIKNTRETDDSAEQDRQWC
jgi:hypothetical protein